MITIKQMEPTELSRIGEVDRSEHITLAYAYRNGQLVTRPVSWQVPRWHPTGPEFSVERLVRQSAPILRAGGAMLGALDGDLLVGVAILEFHLTDTMAQLAQLHVSQAYRRQGIATRLCAEAYRLAKEAGATEIYVSATPSESAVGFYLSQGFVPAREVNEALYNLEPEDIHMIRPL